MRTLALLVRQNGAEVAEHTHELKLSLEQLVFLPPQVGSRSLFPDVPCWWCHRTGKEMIEPPPFSCHYADRSMQAALGLLLAIWPLCQSRRDVADYVVMLLRKAMFRLGGIGLVPAGSGQCSAHLFATGVATPPLQGAGDCQS